MEIEELSGEGEGYNGGEGGGECRRRIGGEGEWKRWRRRRVEIIGERGKEWRGRRRVAERDEECGGEVEWRKMIRIVKDREEKYGGAGAAEER